MKKLFLPFLFFVFLGQPATAQHAITGFGIAGGTNILLGENKFTESSKLPNIGFYGIYDYSPYVGMKFQLGWGQLGMETGNPQSKTSFFPIDLVAMIRPIQSATIRPFLQLGLGFLSFLNKNSRVYDGLLIGGAGFSAPISNNLSVLLSADLRYTTSDQFNNLSGGLNDGYFNLQFGIFYRMPLPSLEFKRKQNFEKTKMLTSIPQKGPRKPDTILTLIELRSRVNLLQIELRTKDEQIRQIRSQLQLRFQKMKQFESEIAALTKKIKSAQSRPVNRRTTPSGKKLSRTFSDKEVRYRYAQAKSLIRSKRYIQAIDALSYLNQNVPTHILKSNFIYWIGECYFAMGQYGKAIRAFDQVEKFKKSFKFDDALIMSGISHLKMGNYSRAMEKFETLLQKFPKSEYRARASRYLRLIQQKIIS